MAYEFNILPGVLECLHSIIVSDILQVGTIHRDDLVTQSTPSQTEETSWEDTSCIIHRVDIHTYMYMYMYMYCEPMNVIYSTCTLYVYMFIL